VSAHQYLALAMAVTTRTAVQLASAFTKRLLTKQVQCQLLGLGALSAASGMAMMMAASLSGPAALQAVAV